MKIKIHTVGRVRSGKKYVDWYVFVQTFRKHGHYLVLISDDKTFGKDENGNLVDGEGYDEWIPDKQTLQDYFNQHDWEVEWLDDKPAWLPNEID